MTFATIIFIAALAQPAASEPASQPASQPVDDYVSPVLPAPVSADKVLAGFAKYVETATSFSADAKKFVGEQFAAHKPGDDAGTLLDSALAVISSEFKAALDDQSAGNKDAGSKFAALAKSEDPYVAVNAAFFAVQNHIAADDLRSAAELLDTIYRAQPALTQYTTHADHMLFLLGYTQAHMLHYNAARTSLNQFLTDYPASPERYRASATQMLTELDRRQPGRLGDVYDLMSYAKRELVLGHTDPDVSDKQAEAVKLLSRLVEEAEQDEKKKGGGGSGQGGGKGKSGKQQKRKGHSSAPRARSETSPGGDEEKDLHRARTARPGEEWGKMPPKEREQILQALQKQFPSQYRELVEQYYRQISKDAPKP